MPKVMPTGGAHSVGRRRDGGPAVGRRPARRLACWRALLVGALLVSLGGCGAGTSGGRGEGDAAGATPGTPVAGAATPAALPGPSVSIGRPTEREIGGPPVPPTPGGAAVPFRSERADLGPIVWTTAIDPRTNAPLGVVTAFPVDAPIVFAAVPVMRWEPSAAIFAEWSYNGTSLPEFATTVTTDVTKRDVWLAFHLTKTPASTWPEGVYAIALLVDGQPAQAASIAIGGEG